MNHRKSTTPRSISRKTALIAGAAGLFAASAAFTIPAANADDGSNAKPTASTTKAAKLVHSLGTHSTAGAYYDAKAHNMVVNVTNNKAAKMVRDAGAKAKTVERSTAKLATVHNKIDKKLDVGGTAYGPDTKSNKIVITADKSVTGAKAAKLKKVAASLGDAVRVEHTQGKFQKYIAGGDAIWGSGARCSAGFNVTVDGKPAMITAGHCGAEVKEWFEDEGNSNKIGDTKDFKFPGNDYALVTYADGVDHPSEVNTYGDGSQKITKAAEAKVGEKVKRSGSTTQVHGGEVQALDQTVDYGDGDKVDGLIKTDVCAEPGDSGGALYDGESAIGLTSGGSGDCSAGGTTFFQPVPDALDALGAEIG